MEAGRDERIAELMAQMVETVAKGEAARDRRLEEAVETLLSRQARMDADRARQIEALRSQVADLSWRLADTTPRVVGPIMWVGIVACAVTVVGGGFWLLFQVLASLGVGTPALAPRSAESLAVLAIGAVGVVLTTRAIRRRVERNARLAGRRRAVDPLEGSR